MPEFKEPLSFHGSREELFGIVVQLAMNHFEQAYNPYISQLILMKCLQVMEILDEDYQPSEDDIFRVEGFTQGSGLMDIEFCLEDKIPLSQSCWQDAHSPIGRCSDPPSLSQYLPMLWSLIFYLSKLFSHFLLGFSRTCIPPSIVTGASNPGRV